MVHLSTASALAPIGHPGTVASQRASIPKPICICCGGPRSQFSAGWCKTCYSKKSRPASFDKDASRTIDVERYQAWTAYMAARDAEAEHREVVKAERAIAAAEKKAMVVARRAEYAAEQARATEEWRAKKLADLVSRKLAKIAEAAQKRAKRVAVIRDRAPSPFHLVYPYASTARPVSTDLQLINSLVPHGIPGREDICQEIMIAVLENAITIDDIKSNRANLRSFVSAFRKANFESGGYAVSLDEPMRDGRSWHDVLVDTREVEGTSA